MKFRNSKTVTEIKQEPASLNQMMDPKTILELFSISKIVEKNQSIRLIHSPQPVGTKSNQYTNKMNEWLRNLY